MNLGFFFIPNKKININNDIHKKTSHMRSFFVEINFPHPNNYLTIGRPRTALTIAIRTTAPIRATTKLYTLKPVTPV